MIDESQNFFLKKSDESEEKSYKDIEKSSKNVEVSEEKSEDTMDVEIHKETSESAKEEANTVAVASPKSPKDE